MSYIMLASRMRAARSRCCIVLVGALGAFLPAVQAQTAAAGAKAPPTAAQLAKYDTNKNGVLDAEELAALEAESKTIVLTPFEVSTEQDRGYAAGNTVSGGRIDTPLALTGASISVMTKEFLDDFGITDINEASAFTLNMDVSTQPNQGPFGTDRFEANFRGAGLGGTGSYPTRDGIQNYFVADTYNSERFEFARGPNSQMFGPGGPGGMQGSSSKRPRYNGRSVGTTFRADSYGTVRGTLDFSQGFDRFAIRVNALHQNTKSYLDATSAKQNALTVALAFKLSEKTELRFQYEKSSEYNIQFRKTWGDNQAFWDRTTVNNTNTTIANAGLAGLSTINTGNDTLTYNFNTSSLINYGRSIQYQTTGLGYQVPWNGRPYLVGLGVKNSLPGFSKSFRLGPIDNIADRDNNTRSITLEHRFSSNLFAQVSWTGSDIDPATLYSQGHPGDYRVDVNRLLPVPAGSPVGTVGAPNPNFLKAYSVWGQNSQYQQNGNDEYMGSLNYQFAAPKWFDMKQRFNLNAGYRLGLYEAWNRAFRWINNPNQVNPTNGSNTLNFRVYYDNPHPAMAPVLNEAAINALNPAYQFRNTDTGFAALNRGQLTYGNLVSQTSFFNERLNITLGFRRDKVTNDNLSNIGNDPANNYRIIMGGANPKTGQNEAGFHSVLTTYRNSQNADTVIYPFKDLRESGAGFGLVRAIRPLGFVVNFSQNFQVPPTGGPLVDGTRPAPPFSETLDLGLRYSIPGGVAYASLSHYNTNQVGQLSGFGTSGNIQNIWRNLGYTDDAHYNFGGYRDLSDRKLEGWEFELTANPLRNLTFTANYSHAIVRTIIESRDRRAYVAANLAEWQKGATAQVGQVINGKTIIDPQIITNNIQSIEDSLNGSTAGTIGNGVRHRINVAGSYRLSEGMLKGVGINAGVNYRGHNKVGSRDPRIKFQTTAPTVAQNVEAAYDYLWTDPTWDLTAGVNYTRRIGKYNTRFQLNVTNLLNNDDTRFSSYGVINAGQLTGQSNGSALTVAGSNPRMQVLNNFQQAEPRKFAFTTTVSF